MRRRGGAAGLLVLVICLLLTGCVGLPAGGPVTQGLRVDAPAEQPPIGVPLGPSMGESPEQIVKGFLRAGTGVENDHEIARQFLTQAQAKTWNPDRSVVVHSGESSFDLSAPSNDEITVSAPTVARLDSHGYYEQVPSGTRTQAAFTLDKVRGQWRISHLPRGFGSWLSSADFDLLYMARSVYYVSGTGRTLVPDVRWFPNTAGLATTLARATLDPVPAYLRGAVTTGAPPGTALAVDSVPVENGLATVDLSGSALGADPDHRRAMWAQFFATLTQVPGVHKVSLRVSDSRLSLPNTAAIPETLQDIGYAQPERSPTWAFLRTGTELSQVDPNRLDLSSDAPAPSNTPGSKPVPLPFIPIGWISLAASPNGEQLAAIGGDHKDLGRWVRGDFYQLPKFGTEFTRPSFDNADGLWVAGKSGVRTRVWALDTSLAPDEARPQQVQAPWLSAEDVLAFRVSPGDQRAVLIAHDDKTHLDRLELTGIVRGKDGRPRRLTAPLHIAQTLTAISDLVWIDNTTLVVLGRTSTQDPLRPYILDLSGEMTALSPVPGTRSLTATGDVQGIFVVTDRDRIYTRVAQTWLPAGTGTDLVVPGA